MKILNTKFGSITIDETKYNHDVYILPDKTIMKRNKHLSPRISGHRAFGAKELEVLLENNPEILFIGKGQSGILPITDEAQKKLNELKIKIYEDITPNLINQFNKLIESEKKIAAIFHTTC